MSETKVYSVTLGSGKRLNIIDVTSGRTVNNIMYDGDILTGPIVVGDKCTLVTIKGTIRKGHIYNLPTGRLAQTYVV